MRRIPRLILDPPGPDGSFLRNGGDDQEGRPGTLSGRRERLFWKGRYYAQILGSDVGEEIAGAARSVAESLAVRVEDGGEPIWGLEALPEKDRISVQYLTRNALSLEFLNDT